MASPTSQTDLRFDENQTAGASSRAAARSLGGSDDALCRHSLPPRALCLPRPTMIAVGFEQICNISMGRRGRRPLQRTNKLLRYTRPRLLRRGVAKRRRGRLIYASQTHFLLFIIYSLFFFLYSDHCNSTPETCNPSPAHHSIPTLRHIYNI